MVSGSGKKPWRQKGTGRARVGEIAQPAVAQGRHGVRAAAARYEYALPKKVERGALRAALAQKLRDGAVTVVEALALDDDQDQGGGRAAASASARPARRWSST